MKAKPASMSAKKKTSTRSAPLPPEKIAISAESPGASLKAGRVRKNFGRKHGRRGEKTVQTKNRRQAGRPQNRSHRRNPRPSHLHPPQKERGPVDSAGRRCTRTAARQRAGREIFPRPDAAAAEFPDGGIRTARSLWHQKTFSHRARSALALRPLGSHARAAVEIERAVLRRPSRRADLRAED